MNHNLLRQLQETCQPAKLMVVTKTRSRRDIEAVIEAGIKDIGESRLQEITKKYDLELFRKLQQEGVRLHFIGQLQSKKINKIVRICDLIQSLDSREKAKKIDQAAQRIGKRMPVLLQLNLTAEAQKGGLNEEQLPKLLPAIKEMKHLSLQGFMTIGKAGDPDASRQAFRRCRQLVDQYQLSECSMGMSGDYQLALAEGSSMVRIGSKIFQDLPEAKA